MPQGTPVRASTQDGTSGTQVATGVNEVSGGGALQTIVGEGNKTTYSEVGRTVVTTADTATVDLSTTAFAGSSGANLIDVGNALNLSIRATCSLPSANLTGIMIGYDGSNNPIWKSEQVSFSSDGLLRLTAAGDYICQRVLMDAGPARKCRFYILSISTGTWSIYVRPL